MRGMRDLAMIPLCKMFKGSEEEDELCKRFEPILTKRGINTNFLNDIQCVCMYQCTYFQS